MAAAACIAQRSIRSDPGALQHHLLGDVAALTPALPTRPRGIAGHGDMLRHKSVFREDPAVLGGLCVLIQLLTCSLAGHEVRTGMQKRHGGLPRRAQSRHPPVHE